MYMYILTLPCAAQVCGMDQRRCHLQQSVYADYSSPAWNVDGRKEEAWHLFLGEYIHQWLKDWRLYESWSVERGEGERERGREGERERGREGGREGERGGREGEGERGRDREGRMWGCDDDYLSSSNSTNS